MVAFTVSTCYIIDERPGGIRDSETQHRRQTTMTHHTGIPNRQHNHLAVTYSALAVLVSLAVPSWSVSDPQ